MTPPASSVGSSAWTVLLDRLEERLRLIEASGRNGAADPELMIGPAPRADDVPAAAPTEHERVRLMALAAAHERVAEKLTARRHQLRQAEHYHLGSG
jgi:hypothetical protein